jgi:hypothetical protein
LPLSSSHHGYPHSIQAFWQVLCTCIRRGKHLPIFAFVIQPSLLPSFNSSILASALHMDKEGGSICQLISDSNPYLRAPYSKRFLQAEYICFPYGLIEKCKFQHMLLYKDKVVTEFFVMTYINPTRTMS